MNANTGLRTRITSLYGSQPSSVLFECETATLASELLVSMGPSPHLWFLHSKQRLYNQNYKSMRVPALTCGLSMRNSDFRTRITRLYCSQTPPVISCVQNIFISTRITSLFGSQPSSVVLFIPNSDFMTRIYNSVLVPDLTCGFVHENQRA